MRSSSRRPGRPGRPRKEANEGDGSPIRVVPKWEAEMRAIAVGEKIARIRDSLGVTQLDLAIACGTTAPTVCNWERGKTWLPSWRICQIAIALGVQPPDLMPYDSE